MTSPNNWQRKLQGFAPMSALSMNVLSYLLEAKAQGWPFVPLPDVHARTLKALFETDLIDVSHGDDGTRYKITVRGERTRQAYLTPVQRRDGLCPDCGLRPRRVTESGRVEGYCLTCASKSKRRAYKLKRPSHNPDSPCSRCHKRKRHVSSGGHVLAFCLHCKNLLNRKRKKRDNKRDVQRARTGEVRLCSRPGCTRQRHVTASCVYVWCREHYREWYNAYRHAKKAQVQA